MMEERIFCLISLVIGYIFGMFQTAYFVGRFKGIDLRKCGSGNLGTTNVFRVLGIRAGIVTYIGDIGKYFAAVIVVYLIFTVFLKTGIDRIPLFLYTGLGAFLGHSFPACLRFKGGKGVAVTSAILISLWDWKMVAVGIIVFFGVAVATQYVSLSSMSMVVCEVAAFIVLTQTNLIDVSDKWIPDCYIILFIIMVLIIWLHRKNIDRLIHGKENKFEFLSEAEIKARDINKK